ncbi:MAG: DUF4399 domain-containing protein [Myxococcota bacterium]|nr:DUF4399 domain-containing protein [Myxococcota bacterium]
METRPCASAIVQLVRVAALVALGIATAWADGDLERKAAPPGAAVYLISPAEGARLTGPVTLRFGLRGMGVAPAGVDKSGTGHHHLLIDTELPPLGFPIPNDAQHRHYGGGQTEVDLDLPPGEHSLQLILGDDRHVPHDPPIISEKVLILVE